MNEFADESRVRGQPKIVIGAAASGASSEQDKASPRPDAADELRDDAGNDRVLDDLERDILGAVRGVVTDFVAKRVGRPDLSDVDVDIELPSETEPRAQQHLRDEPTADQSDTRPVNGLGARTVLPLLLLLTGGVFLAGAGLFYSHVIVGQVPAANGTKVQPIAVERQRALNATIDKSSPAVSTTSLKTQPTLTTTVVAEEPARSPVIENGWVTTTTPNSEGRLEGFSAPGTAKSE